jgi:CRISPR type IV-associated protein Csf3
LCIRLQAHRMGKDRFFTPEEELAGTDTIPIPIAREPGGRYFLASSPQYAIEASQTKFRQRRPVIGPAQMLGDGIKRIDIATGPSKGFRIPYAEHHLLGDTVHWWCMGDQDPLLDLLQDCLYLGRGKAIGKGKVLGWDVQPCEPWPGFPVLQEGRPLRPLPLDMPGLGEHGMLQGRLLPPYHHPDKEWVAVAP